MYLKVTFSREGTDILTLKLDPAGQNAPEVLSGSASWFDLSYQPFSDELGRPVSWQQPTLWLEALAAAYSATASGITIRTEEVTEKEALVEQLPTPGPGIIGSSHRTENLPRVETGVPRVNGFVLSGWGRRVAAYLLDGLFVWILVGAVFVVLAFGISIGGQGSSADGYLIALLWSAILSFPLALCYYLLTMRRKGSHNGQSPGKQIMNIAVIREDSRDVTAGFAFLRQFVVMGFLLGFLSGITFGIATVIDYLSPLWTDKNQAYHDKVVKSYVIRTDVR